MDKRKNLEKGEEIFDKFGFDDSDINISQSFAPSNTSPEKAKIKDEVRSIVIDPREEDQLIENDLILINRAKNYEENKDQRIIPTTIPDYEISRNRFIKKEEKVDQFEKDYFKSYEPYRNRSLKDKTTLKVRKRRPILRTGLTLAGFAIIGFLLKGDD